MSRLPGPWIQEVPGNKPSPGIVRADLEENSWSKEVDKGMNNGHMDVTFPSPTGGQASRGSRR